MLSSDAQDTQTRYCSGLTDKSGQSAAKRRPVFSREMGKLFESLRQAAGLSLNEASDRAAKCGVQQLSRNLFWRLETGQVKHPSQTALRSIAALYSVEYESLSARVASIVYGTSLFSHKSPSSSEAATTGLEVLSQREPAVGLALSVIVTRLLEVPKKP